MYKSPKKTREIRQLHSGKIAHLLYSVISFSRWLDSKSIEL